MSDYGWMQERMEQQLERRRIKGTMRRLPAAPAAATTSKNTDSTRLLHEIFDFASNDYLGLAQDKEQQRLVQHEMSKLINTPTYCNSTASILGATGSRLLSGDSVHFHFLETYLATTHKSAAALLCNSGYDANLSVVSCLPCDCILYDEYAHNSLHMGMRLWQFADKKPATEQQRITVSFQHNSVDHLRQKLEQLSSTNNNTRRRRFAILIESVYSMDGDVAPVKEMLDTALQFGAVVVVDEAHGLGVYGDQGTGVLAAAGCEQHPALAFAVYTFGKAPGCHGAVVCCPTSTVQKDYLINYAYPVIYSTALPLHSVVTIRCAYDTMTGKKGSRLRRHLRRRIEQFQTELVPRLAALHNPNSNNDNNSIQLLPGSSSPIQALIVPGNAACTDFCQRLHQRSDQSVRLFPIKSPTVPAGQERVRIVIHAHNTAPQVTALVEWIVATAHDMTLQRSKL
jgi:8-amino-7-oxononanoate synthase